MNFPSDLMGQELKKVQKQSHNPKAALQRYLVNNGYTVLLSDELWGKEQIQGYVAQLGANPINGNEAFAVARIGKWGEHELGLYSPTGEPIKPLPELPPVLNGVILDLPFVSQLGVDASDLLGDCGVTCVSSVSWFKKGYYNKPNTLAQIMRNLGFNPDYARISELNKLMIHLGLNTYHDTRIAWHEVKEDLKNNNPIIALIEYSKLPKETQFYNYVGGHYVILVGMFFDDEGKERVRFIDPFRPPNDKFKGLGWSHLEDFDLAWQSSIDFSTPRQAIRLR